MPLSQGDQSSSATTRSDQGAAGLTGKSVFVVWLTLAAGLAVALVLMCMGMAALAVVKHRRNLKSGSVLDPAEANAQARIVLVIV